MPSGSKRPSRFVSILGFATEFHMGREFVEVLWTIPYGYTNVIEYNGEVHKIFQPQVEGNFRNSP